jgi:hypothetical protein
MRIALVPWLLGSLLLLAACDETAPVPASEPHAVVGRWGIDVEAFIEENWEQVARGMRAALERMPASDQRPEALGEKAKALLASRVSAHALAFVFEADGSCRFELTFGARASTQASGRWSATAEGVEVVLSESDGKPAKGRDAQPMRMSLRDGLLRFEPRGDGIVMVARRR